MILNGDSLEMLRTLPDGAARCCITSPPYWGLRDYGHAGQIGLERTPDEPESRHSGAYRWPARPGEPQREWEAPRLTKPGMGDSADGLPRWVAGYTSAHRREALNALGNAVVPQVVEIIGRGIMQLENAMRGEA